MDSYYDDGGSCVVHPDSTDLILTGGKGPISQTNWSFVVSYSRDGGSTWTRCNLSGANSGWCYALAVAPSATNIIYAGGTAAGAPAVYRSTDFGANWTQTATAPTDTVFHLEIDPQDAAKVYAATADGVFLSTNSGSTWTDLRSGANMRCVKQFPGNPNTLFTGGARGVSVSYNAGGTWTPFNSGLEGRAVATLEFAVHGGEYLIAGTAGGSCYAWQFTTGMAAPDFIPHPPSLSILPNPFISFCRVAGREGEVFAVFDHSGRQVAATRGDKLGYGLAAGVYFVREAGLESALTRIVKTR
jgi:photosystem II stability/assembly factor-like uncharacterized protein